MAQANVEVKVQSQDLDKLRGKLVELQKGLKIQYDIDGKPIDVVIDKSLNLQKQVRLLTAELRKTKEGTEEFRLLSSRLGQAQDNLAKTTAKSRDLFSSLSMLPGPIGQFFSQLQGGLELLKTFSSFSLKDLQFQFKETADDFAEIGDNILGVNDQIDETSNVTKNAAEGSNQLSESLTSTAAEAGSVGGAVGNATSKINDMTVNLVKSTLTTDQLNNAVQNLTKQGFDVQIDTLTDANGKITDQVISYTDLNDEINILTANQVEAAAAGKKLTMTTEGLVVVEKQATFWTSTLGKTISGVLIATGIGVAIVLIGELVSWLYKLVEANSDATKENERLTESFNTLKRSIADTQTAIKDQTDLLVLQAKIAGKSEEELFRITKEGFDKRVKANQDGRKKIEREIELLSINIILKEEDRLKLQKDLEDKYIELGRQSNELRIEGEKLTLTEELRIAEEGRRKDKEKKDKRLQQNKEYLQKLEQDTKSGLDKLRTLEEQNALLVIEDERKRTAKELEFQKKKEEDEIKALKLKDTKINGLAVTGEQLRAKLLEEVRVKYGQITLNNSKKYTEEDLKILKDFQRKTRDIEIEGIEDKNEREKQKRDEDLKRQIEDLEQDKEFVKRSEEEKEKIRELIRKKFAIQEQEVIRENKKKENEDAVNALDDQLRFLQLKGESLIEGTRAYYQNLRDITFKAEEREIAEAKKVAFEKKKTEEELQKEIKAIQEKYQSQRKDLRQKELEDYLNMSKQIASSISGFISTMSETNAINEQNELQRVKGNAAAQDEIKKKYFEKNKRASIAQAYISTFQSAVDAFLSLAKIPVVGPALGGVAAAAAIAFGQQKISAIRQQQYDSEYSDPGSKIQLARGYARGGMIDGARHAEGGVLIEAEGGEAVMTRGAVSMFGPLLAMMNQAGGGTNFNKDMMFTANDAPSSSPSGQSPEPVIMKTYVVSNELTTEAEKQARLKNLSTL